MSGLVTSRSYMALQLLRCVACLGRLFSAPVSFSSLLYQRDDHQSHAGTQCMRVGKLLGL